MKRLAIAALCLVLAACGGGDDQPETTQPETTQPETSNQPPTTPPPSPPPQTAGVRAEIRVTDLEGAPLAGMIPIATTRPNAFDKPVAQGPPTDANGHAAFTVPAQDRLFVRAWDPELKMFANNFFEVLANQGTSTKEMAISMAASASLDAVLLTPDQTPAANTNVGIMMFHPSEGPWWPGEANTDANGHVHFPALPPGEYLIKVKAANAGALDIPDVFLPPGGEADLGLVALQ